MTNTINFRNALQAALFSAIVVPGLVKGKWAASTPEGHGADWADAKVQVNASRVGVNFEPKRTMYNLLNKDFIVASTEKALKEAAKVAGEEVPMKVIRKELIDVMIVMRTTQGSKEYMFHRGMVGAGKIGRPKNDEIEAIEKAAVSAKTAVKAAKAKPAAKKAASGTKKATKKAAEKPAEAVAA